VCRTVPARRAARGKVGRTGEGRGFKKGKVNTVGPFTVAAGPNKRRKEQTRNMSTKVFQGFQGPRSTEVLGPGKQHTSISHTRFGVQKNGTGWESRPESKRAKKRMGKTTQKAVKNTAQRPNTGTPEVVSLECIVKRGGGGNGTQKRVLLKINRP